MIEDLTEDDVEARLLAEGFQCSPIINGVADFPDFSMKAGEVFSQVILGKKVYLKLGWSNHGVMRRSNGNYRHPQVTVRERKP